MAGQRGGQHARAAADVQHFPFGMRLEGGEQQLAADVQTVAAEDARQGFNRQIIQCVFAQNASASKVGCFSRRP